MEVTIDDVEGKGLLSKSPAIAGRKVGRHRPCHKIRLDNVELEGFNIEQGGICSQVINTGRGLVVGGATEGINNPMGVPRLIKHRKINLENSTTHQATRPLTWGLFNR